MQNLRSKEIKRRAGIKRSRSFDTMKKRAGQVNFSERLPHIAFPSRLALPRLTFPRLPRFTRYKFNILKIRRMKEYFFRVCVVAVILIFLIGIVGLFSPSVRVRVDAETVAAFRVPHGAIAPLRAYAAQNNISFPELFAVFNAENNFFPQKGNFDMSIDMSDFNRVRKRYNSRSLAPYVRMFESLFGEIEAFPIGEHELDNSIMFGDSWGVEQNFQGGRRGTAIVDRENIRGRVPVVSMTRGTVKEAGWDNTLGYYALIVTENNTQYVYAHLDSLAQGLSAGQQVLAGQHLGQMGNSGGGRNAQSFPVHLYISISPDVSFARGGFWINPYPLLRYIEME
ncbi:MAG: M23 family metallopeptidase [Defluviitaleaceae bacterium]|nr:M23 family metallopeptidase [Defluviitaleaceae bacterium]